MNLTFPVVELSFSSRLIRQNYYCFNLPESSGPSQTRIEFALNFAARRGEMLALLRRFYRGLSQLCIRKRSRVSRCLFGNFSTRLPEKRRYLQLMHDTSRLEEMPSDYRDFTLRNLQN